MVEIERIFGDQAARRRYIRRVNRGKSRVSAENAEDADARAKETAAKSLRESEKEVARLAVLAAEKVIRDHSTVQDETFLARRSRSTSISPPAIPSRVSTGCRALRWGTASASAPTPTAPEISRQWR